MGWLVTPRNTATAAVTQSTGTSDTVTITVSATVLGDLCVVAIGADIATIGTVTWTPPAGAGFVQVASTPYTNSPSLTIWASNTVPAGTTSLAFKMAGTSGTLFGLSAIYACWPGGSAPTLSEASKVLNSVTATGTTFTTITGGTEAFNGDLGVWVGESSDLTNPAPTNPSGTGTWTSVATVNGAASGRPYMRMSAQIGANGHAQVASGSTVTSGAVIAGAFVAFPPQVGDFLAFFDT